MRQKFQSNRQQVNMKTVYVGLLLTVMCVCGRLTMADNDRSRSQDSNEESSSSSDGTATSQHSAPYNDTSTSPPFLLENETRANQSDPSLSTVRSLRFSFFITDGGGIDYVEHSVPAMELAVEHINANRSILPYYELTYNLKEIECSSANALDEFFQEIFSQNTNIAFIGNGCPEATVSTAELVYRWNISQIAFSPLPNGARSRAPTLFSTYPSETNFVAAFGAFISQYGWRRLLVITQRESFFTTVSELLQEKTEGLNVSISNREFENEEQLDASKILNESSDYRIIFLNTYPGPARRILCETPTKWNPMSTTTKLFYAHSRGYVYPYYTWILYGWYSNNWWEMSESRDCSNIMISEVLERAVSIQVYPMPTDYDSTTDTGFTYNQFQEEYMNRLDSRRPDHHSFIASLTYDAVWTLAIALHHTDTLTLTTSPVAENNCAELQGDRTARIDQFDYSNGYLGCLIEWQLRQTNFSGVSGLVTFDAQSTRLQNFVNLVQYRVSGRSNNLELKTFASYNLNTNELEFRDGESNSTVYPDGIPPDGTPENIIVTFHLGLTITYYVIAAIGIICATLCLIFNFKYRNTRVVKLTSPRLNYILIAGGYLMFLSLYPRLIPHTGKSINEFRCIVQNWMNITAYCVAYGIILAKMGRVYIIFHNPSPKKSPKGIKDWHMVLVVVLVTGIGIFLVTLETLIPQIRPKPELLPSDEHSPGKDHLGVTVHYYVWQCYGTGDTPPFYFLVVIFCYLCLLQFIGLVLAIKTRKVKINILNDSKYIAATIYVSSLVVVVMALVVFVSGIRLNTNEAFFSGGLLLSTFVFMGFTFLPKVISYYRDPHGERVLKSVTGTHHVQMDSSGALTLRKPNQERINTLERKVTELEEQLNTYKSLENVSQSRESIRNIIMFGSPAATLSDLSESSLSHGSSLGQANNFLFDQQSSADHVASHYQCPSCLQVINICHHTKKETTERHSSSLTKAISYSRSPPSVIMIRQTESLQNPSSLPYDGPTSQPSQRIESDVTCRGNLFQSNSDLTNNSAHGQYEAQSDIENCSLAPSLPAKASLQAHSQGAEDGKRIAFSSPDERVTTNNSAKNEQ